MPSNDETIREAGSLAVCYGGSLKAVEGEEGWVAGNIITFTDANNPDLVGDFFTAKTELDTDFPSQVSVYFHHGLDPVVGKKSLARGEVTMTDEGVAIKAKLSLETPMHRVIYDRCVEGTMGWSTGAVPWLVERKSVGTAKEVTRWPFKEASITPTPAFPGNTVMALKSVLDAEEDLLTNLLRGSSKLSTLGDAALGAVEQYLERLQAVKAMPERKELSWAHQRRLYRLKEIAEILMAEVAPVDLSAEVNDELVRFCAAQSRAIGLDV